MRFDLVDAITEQTPGRIVAVKAVTAAEEYLADHFPGFPVLPGVMMLEAMVQASRRILHQEHGPGPWTLAEARNIRYGQMVRPGERLCVTVELLKSADPHTHTFAGRGEVDGETAVQGRLLMTTRRRD